MTVSTSASFGMSITIVILLLASMQLYKVQLASTELMTIVSGGLGSLLFVTLLTAIGNFEKLAFGRGFQTSLFPEVIGCLAASMFASALVHRIAASTCFIFSCIALYYVNRVSQSTYGYQHQEVATSQQQSKKRK